MVKTSHGIHNIIQQFKKYKSNLKSEICNAKFVDAFWRLEEQRGDTKFERKQICHLNYDISTPPLQSPEWQSCFKCEAINRTQHIEGNKLIRTRQRTSDYKNELNVFLEEGRKDV